jgi:flagellar biogenesis protein FliO
VELIMMVVLFTTLISLSAVLAMVLYFLFWLQRVGS